MEIQVILSLIVILASACIALLVDHFRNKHQRVREALVEKKVRQIEEQRQMLAASAAPTVPAPDVVLSPVTTNADFAHENTAPLVSTTAQSEQFTPRKRHRYATGVPGEPGWKGDDMDSKRAFSNWLVHRAAARAARRLASAVPVAVEPSTETVPEPSEPPAALELAESQPEQIVIEPPQISGFESKFEPVVIDEFLWRSLFENKADRKQEPIVVAAAEEDAAPVQRDAGPRGAAPAREPGGIPTGFRDAAELQQLKQTGNLFCGLVVCVGVTHGELQGTAGFGQSVTECVQTLLRDSDFGCRTAEDEYLLICPGLTGKAAQRHLSGLSERLWDFQLRSLGSYLMLFSLGGVDVEREPLGDAIASATERMAQTKRSRRSNGIPATRHPRRKAVS